ncbi:hypothetical protein QN397_13565 [Variovorax sp. RTB1]|uniref:hypothetical protein n=1 Tax=Variovorax sp. RTB1 TaxID=3048631 RepID=UPI002B236148|nr:hypothetical protein [Variovorax sp. RTB1]MEB0112383.1 hypothetical protein [Variovorax sp. RTB1]
MTDSLTIRLDLSHLSDFSRERIGQLAAQRQVMRRRVGKRTEYFRPKKFASPLSGANLTLDFMQADDNPESLPNAVVADLSLPSALFGQNYTHETNVWAAATAGVKLVKIVLAQAGLSAGALATLRAEHITMETVTLTFLYPLGSQAEADLRVKALGESLHAMLPLKIHEKHTTNRTLYFDFPDFLITVYNKTKEKTISWPVGAPVEIIRAQGERLVRLEVKLRRHFLAKRELHRIEA